MSYFQTDLWQAIAAMQIEPDGAATSFTAKLARETGWDRSRAEAVVGEYRRFLYLAGVAGHPVSPSKAIDQAWHLHLTYSRHYWDVLCGRILGRPLHHDPSLGGAAEDARHRDQYARTLALYRLTFGEEPPASIWPGAVPQSNAIKRLAHPVRWAGAAMATTLLAACAAVAATGAKPEEEEGDALLGFIIIGAFMAFVYFVVKRVMRGRGRGRGRRAGAAGGGAYGSHDTSSDWDDRNSSSYDSSDSSSDGGSSCGGGCGGGGD